MAAEPEVKYDVIVIGGGPAGMMAAGRAAQSAARVLLLEKNPSPGKKLLITGGGRCNLTNAQPDHQLFLDKFGPSAKYLHSAFAQFGVPETMDFFHKNRVYTKIEAEYRVFPSTEQAQTVLDALRDYIAKVKVEVRTNAEVSALEVKDGRIAGVRLGKTEKLFRAHTYILATGGKSHPETGSTGEGFQWLKSIGHMIVEPDSALVPIKIKGKFVKKLGGLSFDDAKLTLTQEGKKPVSRHGKLLFTHFGLSGPLALNMSKQVGEWLRDGDVTLSLDILQHMDHGAADRHVQALFAEHQNKMLKNVVGYLVPPKMESALLDLTGIDPDTFINKVTRAERQAIVRFLKGFQLHVQGLIGPDQAIVTSGGVPLKEVNFKTMQSRVFDNLFLVGDLLDIDRPSGGYSLQLCWTTGWVAGTSAARVARHIAKEIAAKAPVK